MVLAWRHLVFSSFYSVPVLRVGCRTAGQALVYQSTRPPDNRHSVPAHTQTHTESDNLDMAHLTMPFRPGCDPEVRVHNGRFHHPKFLLNDKNREVWVNTHTCKHTHTVVK